jgi:heme/copper-type cytochrome/quinol oxidase subunit 2
MPFRLADAIFWVAVACCCIAQLAIIRSIVRSPSLGDAAAPSSRARRAAEVAWAIIPGIALAVVLAFTWRAMHQAPSAVTGARPAAVTSQT